VHFGNPSNWVRHLKTHEQQHEEYKSSAKMSRKRARSPSREVFKQPQPKKQLLDQPSILDAMNPEKINERKEKKEKLKQLATDHQKRIDAKVLSYVVAEALPISTVSSESFREMLREIDDRVNVLCSKTLRRNIAAEFTRFKLDLKVRFSKASCICLTADIWGSKNRSFLGVTAHWIEVDGQGKLHRRSAGIACKRFYGIFIFIFYLFDYFHKSSFFLGKHDYSSISKKLDEIIAAFDLHCKVNFIVTDNGSNFVKAFKEFAAVSYFFFYLQFKSFA
jgi:hypothetical protein